MTLPSDWRLLYKNTEGRNRGKINDCLLGFFLKKIQEIRKIFVLKIMDESNDASEYTGGAYLGFSMIRIPEMYYIMAEALLEGDRVRARDYLDIVVSARGMVKFARSGYG